MSDKTTRNPNGPVQKLDISPLSAAIFLRQPTTKEGETFNAWSVEFTRTYKDETSGEFKYTTSFRPRDLKNLGLLAEMAQKWIEGEEAALAREQRAAA